MILATWINMTNKIIMIGCSRVQKRIIGLEIVVLKFSKSRLTNGLQKRYNASPRMSCKWLNPTRIMAKKESVFSKSFLFNTPIKERKIETIRKKQSNLRTGQSTRRKRAFMRSCCKLWLFMVEYKIGEAVVFAFCIFCLSKY